MIVPDIKKAITTIMAKRPPKDSESPSGASPSHTDKPMIENGEIDGCHVAANDVMKAIEEKSPQKLMQALSNFLDMHDAKSSSEMSFDR